MTANEWAAAAVSAMLRRCYRAVAQELLPRASELPR
jgi:hypothetical protein